MVPLLMFRSTFAGSLPAVERGDSFDGRLGLPSHDQLHHFVSSEAWDDGPLWRVLAEKADTLLAAMMPCWWSTILHGRRRAQHRSG
jgi:hypothetical protein